VFFDLGGEDGNVAEEWGALPMGRAKARRAASGIVLSVIQRSKLARAGPAEILSASGWCAGAAKTFR